MNLGHGGNVDEIIRKYNLKKGSLIDFSANINPVGINKKVKEEMILALNEIERYPDITYHDLKMGLCDYDNINYEDILLGNGAAEVIFNIVRGLKPKKVLLPQPTFSEYEDAAKSVDANIEYYIIKNNDFSLDNDFISAINDSIDMLFICNPNNPTGVLTSKEYIKLVLEKSMKCNTMVIIDESFIDFVEDKENYSVIQWCKEYKNLIVVKSLTKFFAFPGIRIGYGVCGNNEIIEKVNKISIPWSINTVAAYGGNIALSQNQYIEESRIYVKIEKDFLFNELHKFKELLVYKPAVNFIFFKVYDNINLKEKLLNKGILIRSCDNYAGLNSNYYRVAVRTHDENIKLIRALQDVFININ